MINQLKTTLFYAFALIFTLFYSAVSSAQLSSLPNGFPDNDGSSGKMLDAINGFSTLGESGTDVVLNVHIRVQIGSTPTLDVEIFDGDFSTDFTSTTEGFYDVWDLNLGIASPPFGIDTIYELYPDVDVVGNTSVGLLASATGSTMADNDWSSFISGMLVDTSDATACQQGAGAEFCFYHLVARWNTDPLPPHTTTGLPLNLLNTFKVSSNGLPFLAAGSSIGFIGWKRAQGNDVIVPETDYDGVFGFKGLVTESAGICALDLYDGDFDLALDGDDPTTPNVDPQTGGFYPFPISAAAFVEGVNPGNPADDNPDPAIALGGNVNYTITPDEGSGTSSYGVPGCCVNTDPSGNQEFELFRIASTAPGCPVPVLGDATYDPDGEGPQVAAAPDVIVNELSAGFHNVDILGMDPGNTNFINFNVDVFAGEPFDFGDAPLSYSTLIADGGPQHSLDGRLIMGAEFDGEFDGRPSAGADGDDLLAKDDEDGVATFPAISTDAVAYTVDVTVVNDLAVAATLNGWIDFNGDGDFLDAGELASSVVNPGDTSVPLNFSPLTLVAGDTYARFRISSDAVSVGTPGGLSPDGEVEDYTLTIDEGQQQALCVVILDEDAIDNDISSIEDAANSHNVEPDWLVNDNNPVEVGNPWFNWNISFPGDVVLIPSGETQDEGWFFLPENPPWPVEDFIAGTIPQDQLDKIDNVQPLDNDDLMALVGQTCIAIVYDSDISINYDNPINGNLQGARYGKFAFTVLEAQDPSLPESTSSSSLKDMLIRVEGTDVGNSGGSCSGNTAGSVRDNFTDQVYSNNDGSRNWSSNWSENDSSGNQATGGNVKITNGKLRLRRTDSSIQREVDLCASSNATLSFRYKMSNNVDADDQISVEVSSDGGSNWSQLDQYTGKVGWTTASYDISSFSAANTRVRFRVGNSYTGSGEWFIVNWLEINSD